MQHAADGGPRSARTRTCASDALAMPSHLATSALPGSTSLCCDTMCTRCMVSRPARIIAHTSRSTAAVASLSASSTTTVWPLARLSRAVEPPVRLALRLEAPGEPGPDGLELDGLDVRPGGPRGAVAGWVAPTRRRKEWLLSCRGHNGTAWDGIRFVAYSAG